MGFFNTLFSSQGDTKTSMKVQITALTINIILDPIFIYFLGYGVKGAAIATIIAFGFGLILSLYYLKRKSLIQIKLSSFKLSFKLIKEIVCVGFPAALTMIFMSLSVIFTNKFMIYYGVEYVAAFGIAFRLESVAVMPIVAISLSMLTLAGMFYGAKRYDLLKNISFYSIKIGVLIGVGLGLFLFLFPSLLLRIFTSDTTLLTLSSGYLRVIVFTYPLIAISMILGRALQGMGIGLPALISSLFRAVIIYAPLAAIFVFVLDKSYLFIPFSMITAALVGDIVAVIWFRSKIKKLKLKI